MPKTDEVKQTEAAARQLAYSEMTTLQKLDTLDKRLGVGVGAKRQRAKLQKQLQLETPGTPAPKNGVGLPSGDANVAANKKKAKKSHQASEA